jgi:integrase
MLSLGLYPEVSLKDARIRRDEAKFLLRNNEDPSKVRQTLRASSYSETKFIFKNIALGWHSNKLSTWSPEHGNRILRQMERDLFPSLGNLSIKEITGLDILNVLKKVEERGAIETADRGLMIRRQIWNFVALDGIPDVTNGIKQKLKPYRGKNYAAIVDPEQFGELLRSIDSYKGSLIVRTALKISPLLFQRPVNIRHMKWEQLNLKQGLWTISAQEMKGNIKRKTEGEDHVVPLPSQAITLLEELKPFTGNKVFVFPGERQRDKPISENSVRSALYALGYGKAQSWHGFRASGRTMLDEVLNKDRVHLEAQLAHSQNDPNGRSYNRGLYLQQRTQIIQEWADYLDKLKGE